MTLQLKKLEKQSQPNNLRKAVIHIKAEIKIPEK